MHLYSCIPSLLVFSCWLSVETHLLYIIHGPVMAALVVRIAFIYLVVVVENCFLNPLLSVISL